MVRRIVVIGAGPAGVSAALYAASRGMHVLMFESGQVGGTIGTVSTVTHYTAALPDETGASLAERMSSQVTAAGVEVRHEHVSSVFLTGDVKRVTTDVGSYEASAIVIANGTTPRRLGIPGEDVLAGCGMGMNAARDGRSYAGKDMYVVGGSDGAVKEAIFLAGHARKLTIIHFEERLAAIPQFTQRLSTLQNVDVRLGTRLAAVRGDGHVGELDLVDVGTGACETIEDDGCGIFVYAGSTPNTELYDELALDNGYIVANEKMETAIAGVWAAGDIRAKQVRQVATAVADGAIAGINAAAYIEAHLPR